MTAENATPGWDHTVDLLIVGSGAGAMAAAIVAHDRKGSALIIEKSDRYGGNTAMSGGGLWAPNNHLMAAAGVPDSPEDAWTYLKGTVGDAVPEERLRAYLETVPEMVRYMTEQTRARFIALPEYADYYQNIPGCRPGGRSIEPLNFDARQLGDEFLKMRSKTRRCSS